jgi:hypothetical protein
LQKAFALYSLEDFVHFVDDEFDFASFADLLPTCAKDVVAGLTEYLHTKNIADEFCISIRI